MRLWPIFRSFSDIFDARLSSSDSESFLSIAKPLDLGLVSRLSFVADPTAADGAATEELILTDERPEETCFNVFVSLVTVLLLDLSSITKTQMIKFAL